MKNKIFSLILGLFICVSLFTPFCVSAEASSQTETFYGYKVATYKMGEETTTYNSSWGKYYRLRYMFNYKVYSNSEVKNANITIYNTGARSGNVARYCFGNADYYITKVVSDIDFYDRNGWPPESYWQPQVSLYLDGTYKGIVQYESNDVQTNGSLSNLNWYAKNKCLVWHADSTNTNGGRNTSGSGGDNYIKYYVLSIASFTKGWYWSKDEFLSENSNVATNTIGQTTGYLPPNWSAPRGWRSSLYYSEVYYGVNDKNIRQDRVPVSFTVTYHANGATSGNVSKNVNTPKLANNNYVREGYKFIGWNTKADGTGTSYSAGQDISSILTEGGSLTLYAQWQALTYTVKFDANGGEGSMPNQTLQYDTYANLNANTFTRTGYEFIGWSTTSNGSVVYKDKQSVINIAQPQETITLYAVWKDIVKPNIKNNSETSTSCRVIGGSAINWTNKSKVASITFTDNESGLNYITVNGSEWKTNLGGVKEKTFEYTFLKNGTYKFVAYDMAGNTQTLNITIDCIDKAKPQPKFSLSCGSKLVNGQPIIISFTDDLSGVREWQYRYVYTKADGSIEKSPINSVFPSLTSSINLEPKITDATTVSLEITAYDNAGNVYTTTTCSYEVAQTFTTDTTLNDYTQIVAVYNNNFYRWGLSTSSFMSDVESLNTDTSKAFLSLIKDYMKENNLTQKEAITQFFEDFGLTSQLLTTADFKDEYIDLWD